MNVVMTVSMVLCAAIGIWGVADPESMTGAAQWLVNYSLTALDWFYLLLCTFFFFFMVAFGFSKYGNIKLGGDDEEPEFSTGSWVAMLFATGMGSGLLFWGVAEPIYHFTSPPGLEGETPEAARQAFVITNFHWGLHAWSIYGCCALVIAYFTFRHNLPSMISTPILVGFKNVFNRPFLRGLGSAADILAVIAVIFGLAGSLAMGTLMVRSGMHSVFGTDNTSNMMSFAILGVMTVCFLLSACTGVDKGIKILSNINMIVAIIILLVVLFGGPTAYLFQVFVNSIGDYLIQFIPMSFKIYSYQPPASWNWFHGWTLTYLIWWLAWGPFVGIFIARISRGTHDPGVRDLRGRGSDHRVHALVCRVRRRGHSYRDVRCRRAGRAGICGCLLGPVCVPRVFSGLDLPQFPLGLPDLHLPGNQCGLGDLRHQHDDQ